jgi:hypothetical protein
MLHVVEDRLGQLGMVAKIIADFVGSGSQPQAWPLGNVSTPIV